jgi:hypothetical protein
MAKQSLGTGQRQDMGKLRYDLINPLALEGMVKALTKGSLKYADHNWENGMAWSKVIGSLERHLFAIMRGEDYDFYPDSCEDCRRGTCIIHTGELHVDNLQCNAHFLAAYYRIYPQGDDRFLKTRPRAKIGLDIDEVLCDFVRGWNKLYNCGVPTAWSFDWEMGEKFKSMKESGTLDEFYLNLEPKLDPKLIPFEPHCYVTSRPVDTEVTKKWLDKHGFPLSKVITIPINTSKVEVLKSAGVDIFVDDRYENYQELNENGICCFLWDAPHNQRYNVGYRRIKSLKEILA